MDEKTQVHPSCVQHLKRKLCDSGSAFPFFSHLSPPSHTSRIIVELSPWWTQPSRPAFSHVDLDDHTPPNPMTHKQPPIALSLFERPKSPFSPLYRPKTKDTNSTTKSTKKWIQSPTSGLRKNSILRCCLMERYTMLSRTTIVIIPCIRCLRRHFQSNRHQWCVKFQFSSFFLHSDRQRVERTQVAVIPVGCCVSNCVCWLIWWEIECNNQSNGHRFFILVVVMVVVFTSSTRFLQARFW